MSAVIFPGSKLYKNCRKTPTDKTFVVESKLTLNVIKSAINNTEYS